MRKIILFIILFLNFILVSFANFQPIKSLVYLENKDTQEIKVFETRKYTTKKTWELAFIDFIDNKKNWDTSLFNKWFIIQVCPDEENCYNEWDIQTWIFSIVVNDGREKGSKNLYEKHNLKIIDHSDFTLWENIHIFYKTIFLSSFLIYLFFLPLNLFIFYCFWYWIYLFFFKKMTFQPLFIIYFSAFLLYTIYSILLLYFWYSLLNFLPALFWFMVFFYMAWFFKIIPLLISKRLIKKHNQSDKLKSNFHRYILCFYLFLLFLGLLYNIYLNLF